MPSSSTSESYDDPPPPYEYISHKSSTPFNCCDNESRININSDDSKPLVRVPGHRHSDRYYRSGNNDRNYYRSGNNDRNNYGSSNNDRNYYESGNNRNYYGSSNRSNGDCDPSFQSCVAFIIIIMLFTASITFLCVNFTGVKKPIPDPDDATKVPRTFQLRWRSIFSSDYTMIIESYDTNIFSLSRFSGHNDSLDDTGSDDFDTELSINTTSNIKYPTRALILDRYYDKGEYSVEEYFYKPNRENYYKKIITANAKFVGNWPAEFLITFTTKGSNRSPDAVEVCDYKLSYSKDLTGSILRKCSKANETEFLVQAYISGSVDSGLQFTKGDESDVWYAFTTKPDWFYHYQKRDIYVHEGAPFPPIIPALFSVYYDFLIRKLRN